ncbi:MAG: hypothetical protein LC804_24900 [Acidobacteria bacterium]|nr:hypothetical protein [Acidobacteriota bacterium]
MTRRVYGMLAGLAGSAIGAWWWRHRGSRLNSFRDAQDARDRGTVIFDNTPTASEEGVL